MTKVPVNQQMVDAAVAHIQSAIDSGRDGTDVEVTALGCFTFVTMALGISLDGE